MDKVAPPTHYIGERARWIIVFLGLSLFFFPQIASAFSRSYTVTVDRQPTDKTLTLTNLPPSMGNVTIKMDLYGYYYRDYQTADLFVDGQLQATHHGGAPNCNTTVTGRNAKNSKTYTLPASVVADHKLVLRVVTSRWVYLCRRTPNKIVLTIRYTEGPDLVMSSFSITSSVRGAGSRMTIRYTVRNQNRIKAGSFRVMFYYKKDTQTSGLLPLISYTFSSGLNGNTSVTRTATCILPNSLASGYGYIHYFIDDRKRVAETFENNNRGYKRFRITNKSDLIVSYFSASSVRVFPGTTITLRFRVTNNGYVATPTSFFTGFYFSMDSRITTRDTYLHSESIPALNAKTSYPNSSSTRSFTVKIPLSAAPGYRYLGAFVDYNNLIAEDSDSNNIRTIRIEILQPRPDLSMKRISITNGTGYNSRIKISCEVQNTGRANSTGFAIQFFYGDSATSHSSQSLGIITSSGIAKGRTSGLLTRTIVLPRNVVYGRRYIHYVIDPLNTVIENNEKNNKGTASFYVTGKPDLKVVYLNRNLSSVYPGGRVTLSYRVQNAGLTKVTRTPRIGFYYSTDSSISTRDTYLGSASLKTLDALEFYPASTVRSYTVTIPRTAKAGTIYLGAYVDYGRQIDEGSRENNNTRSVPINVVVKTPDLLAVRILPSKKTVQTTKSFTVTYEIKNIGTADVSSFDVYFYHSTDMFISTADRYLGSVRHSLKAGASVKRTKTLTLPSSVPASFSYVGFLVDPKRRVKETDKSNNAAYAPVRVVVDADGDGFTSDVDCNDKNKAINPKAKEVCDGIDNDCDHFIDEGCHCVSGQKRICYTGGGGCQQQSNGSFTCHKPCSTGTQVCKNGRWSKCLGEVAPAVEKCNNIDDDCNGKIDDNLTKPCYSGPKGSSNMGICKKGISTCKAGHWGKCIGEVLPKKQESCNNQDDDCNGQVDEGLVRDCYNGPKKTAGVGECRKGIQTCIQGSWGLCQGEIKPVKESCNNRDDDCNGKIDDGLVRKCYTGKPSTQGVGECKGGQQTCQAGHWGKCVGEVIPTFEVCNGKDDDCDGQIDNSPKCHEPEVTEEPAVEPIQDAGQELIPEPTKEVMPELDCYQAGCPNGKICKGGQCIDDPCASVQCADNEFCRDGRCVPTCSCVSCPKGEMCVDGQCQKDPCANVSCEKGKVCDPQTSQCIDDPCEGVSCRKGLICEAGQCVDDPCRFIHCPNNGICVKGQCTGGQCSEPEVVDASEPQDEPAHEETLVEPEPSQEVALEPEPLLEKKVESSILERTVGERANGLDQDDNQGQPAAGGCGCTSQKSSSSLVFIFALLLFLLLPFVSKRS